ncbi:MAG: CAP domain-containing protein [Cyanobacteria bacterium HKST-UBA02]|nr:CAP domain-containing protein [Cyanobacteria bacterium HKST-UBA02]
MTARTETPTTLERYSFELINKSRKNAGAAPVALSPALCRFARAHARDMLANNYFSHSNQLGENAQKRALKAGIKGGVYENLGWQDGPEKAKQMVEELDLSFMSEPEGAMNHRGIILKAEHKYAGVGIAEGKTESNANQIYLVQVFTDLDPDAN